jgi:hypothetical protein
MSRRILLLSFLIAVSYSLWCPEVNLKSIQDPPIPVVVAVGIEGSGHHMLKSLFLELGLNFEYFNAKLMRDQMFFEVQYMKWLLRGKRR